MGAERVQERKEKEEIGRTTGLLLKSIKILSAETDLAFFDFFFLFGSDHRYACTLGSRMGYCLWGGLRKEKLEGAVKEKATEQVN